MTGDDPETEAGDAAGRTDGPAPSAATAVADPTAGRREALGELGRLALLAPALAVLFDPERAQAAS